MSQRFWVKGAGEGEYIEYLESREGIRIRIGDREIGVDLAIRPGSSFLHLLADGRSYPCTFREEGNVVVLNVRGREFRFDVLSERRKRIRDLGIAAGSPVVNKEITAPIPGLVVEIEVRVGQAVSEGQGVVIMEAMKMENELKAPASGVVREIKVAKGTPVQQGQVLVTIE
ncbi:MAG: hypothetical protein A2Z06_04790 [Candidatus Glassbacteria bacterium RBG_16_58_8]|uniref:Lipoyl-binding domain-containing protein n=1 Tax=Candidatus Glassbacteria bacterium RBG_16_58_8 TaxID=1817866 RepID=A0A1F5YBT5_9BACT|nr:MAG: hypothetical protein A2Z06_04790 [Candidatus Glassbacteria bacterium RBG_16_58_8]